MKNLLNTSLMSRRTARALLLSCLMSSSLVGVPALNGSAIAHAEGTEANEAQARVHYNRALELYNDGAFDAALVELNRAWELLPSYKLLYNIAQVQTAMKDYAGALNSYRRYLAEGRDEIPAPRRSSVDKQLQTLSQRVATLQIVTDVAGAEIWIDDVLVGRTPELDAVLVNAGIRVISVRRTGYSQQTQRLSVLGGSTRKLSFVLSGEGEMVEQVPDAPSSPNGAAAPSPLVETTSVLEPQPTPRDSASVLQPWMGWVATGVVAAAATGTGIAAWSESEGLKEQRETFNVRAEDLQSSADDVSTLALVSDVLWVATVAGAGATLWWTLKVRQRERRENVALNLNIMPTGVRLGGTF